MSTPIKFPKLVREAFVELGKNQRDKPERMMTTIQFLYGGGVLNPLIEHAGDITHRMTHMVQYTPEDRLPSLNELGYGNVEAKVYRCLRILQHSYGFEREMKENIAVNYEFQKEKNPSLTFEQYVDKIDTLLGKYAKLHSELKVYNVAQYKAREVAVAIGNKRWYRAEENLLWLKRLVDNEERYLKECSLFTLNSSGNPVPYS